ncbi:helix-turn-helix domain-containing protein [Rahnella woolbedingensis]|uniref:XRE family transcriptional regulator n=1 Tax=Rahnella woolbedingensis TaxID=1510574 RepID=A0A419N7Y6_9GAMM|nr:helix-turn-helix transcriptional regulator [Rahnella woolbedingensis]RJT43570.1 XRE family transcriptional regulator [Rahnella woolbedingensis]
MKRSQTLLISDDILQQLHSLGRLLAEGRIARRMTQSEAAVRANLGRNTVSRIENGDSGVAIGQILRYLDAIRPGQTLSSLLNVEDNVVNAMNENFRPKRARVLSEKELKDYDF